MDRGVIVGGGLIAASFLGAVLLNRSAHQEARPAEAARKPPVYVCEEARQRPPGAPSMREGEAEKCKSPGEAAQR
jgi:hypothetical protein